jgi:hypothetical protein
LQEAYKFPGYREGDFPIAERVCKEIRALPMKGVTEEDVIKICNIGTVKSSMKRGGDMQPQSSRRNSLWSQSYKIGKAIN